MHIEEPSQSAEQYTIADLIHHAQTEPQSVISDPSVKSYASTLRSFARKTRLSEAALAADLLGDEFEDHLAQVNSKFDKSRLRKWQQLYRQLTEVEQQEAFGDVLRAAMKSKGITQRELADKLGVKQTTISNWNCGSCLPCDRNAVEKLEAELCLKSGTLARLLPEIHQEPHEGIPKSWWPRQWNNDSFHSVEKRMATVYFLGQPNLFLPEEDLKPLFDEAVRRVKDGEHLLDWRRKHRELISLPYILKLSDWPAEMQKQWEAIEKYMTSSSGFSNQNRNSQWRATTARIKLVNLERYAGFLTLPANSYNAKLRGPGIEVQELSFAHFLDENNFVQYAEFVAARSGGYPTSLQTLLALLKLLIRKDTGYFYSFPDKLPSRLAFKGKDAEGRRLELRELYSDLMDHRKSLEEWSTQLRETFDLIQPILDHQCPRDLVLAAIEEYGRDIMRRYPYRPGQSPSPRAATQWRDLLLLHMLIRFPLRRSHWTNMTFLENNEGHLFHDKDGILSLRLPYSEFKNEANQTYFSTKGFTRKREMILPFGDDSPLGEVRELAEIYLSHFRSVIAHENSPYVFCGGQGQKLSDHTLSGRISHWSFRYLSMFSYKKTRLEGVYSFSIHTFRHIVATDAVKNEGIEAAAALLLDDPKQVLAAYARFLPEDAVNRAFSSRSIFRPGHVVKITPQKAWQ
ncbi:helix-turn-helix domain-containing protein [Deinococcus sp. SL84]|uniref:helix-turn-helix domain-containing protein n=1 Tax=Deinococcus sp. SL84 TaxID=2994663 RepID=UPI002275AB9C|nr:helix-turn-helix domain-containing protein [Deinococcus sp. SL84]MCY1704298.1 helix-turn-helix domain-containing protein [Deinococcus sp. SL84]